MELRHLIYFKTVAEELHFRNAASKLFISQPPLSRQIRELEEELGVQLFSRSNKRVALTNAGKYFKEETDAILARLDESKSIVKQIHSGESGEFKIGYISSVYQTHLAEVLKSMHQLFPYINTSLYEVPTITQVQELEQGKLDAGILRAPVHSEKLAVKSLFFDPFVLVVPTGTKQFNTYQEMALMIKNSPFIFFNKEFAPHYNDKLLEICERMGFKPDITHEANNVHSILQLIEAGLGISILPASLEKQYGYLQVSFIQLKNIPINTEVVLAYKASNKGAALKWFIENYKPLHSL
jgi:DNA-binding transcriptional LysR family regulator